VVVAVMLTVAVTVAVVVSGGNLSVCLLHELLIPVSKKVLRFLLIFCTLIN